ncbi:MAG TPA: DALR anticodon-binding domain-containing protein [Streptosporangiaceae bacterium]|nr:DALR anticodon-binding domain-containing protein [Streptosporangiaceae bacterium]
MILGDLSAELARLLNSLAATGALPRAAASLTASGTWRQAAGPSPGRYVTSLPFELASLSARPPQAAAALLATELTRLAWVSAAEPDGGYLTITVTPAHLAALPARIVAAGSAAARSEALAGLELTAPYPPDLAATATWQQAWRAQHAAIVGRLGDAAGAHVLFFHSESKAAGESTAKAHVGDPPVAVAYFGLDAVRFALAAASTPRPAVIERQLSSPLDLTNPLVMIAHARADAASTPRWAADLGLLADERPGQARTLEPPESRLIDVMSWLPERIAAAYRRRRPADLVGYLEHLARAWLDCSESCSVLPFRGRGAGGSLAGIASRLELAEAASTTLTAGLGLIGVAAPAMM